MKKIWLMLVMRPRIWSGVCNWRIVLRMMVLTESAPR
jgi:hypothetical protein